MAPHMVTFGGSQKFYSRNSTGKFPMDVDEIRSAFLSSSEIVEEIDRWCSNRVHTINEYDGIVQLARGAKLV